MTFDYKIFRKQYSEDGRRIKPCSGHRTYKRRIIREVEYQGNTYSYHATKGWRITRTGD